MIFSQAARRYVEFYDLLVNNVEITDDNVWSFNKETRTVVQHMLAGIIEEARNEWVSEVKYREYPKTAKMKCSICNTRIQKVYTINNSTTGEQLQVGSECVKQFVDKKQLKLAERNHRSYLLNMEYPGIESIIKGWKKELIREVVLPRELEVPYNRLQGKIQKIYSNFLDGIIPDEKFGGVYREIGQMLAQKRVMAESFDKYVEEHKGADWVVTRNIYNWLLENRDIPTINMLTDSGYLSPKNAGNIAEPQFLGWVCNRTNGLLKESGVKLQPYPDRRGYTFSFAPLPQANLLVTNSLLFKALGTEIFENRPIGIDNLFNITEPLNNSAYEIILREIGAQLAKSGLRHYDSDIRFGEAIFVEPLTAKYYTASFGHLVRKFMKHIYLSNFRPDSAKSFITDSGNSLTKEQAVDKVNIWRGRI